MRSPKTPAAVALNAASEILARMGPPEELVDQTVRTTLEELVLEIYRPRAELELKDD